MTSFVVSAAAVYLFRESMLPGPTMVDVKGAVTFRVTKQLLKRHTEQYVWTRWVAEPLWAIKIVGQPEVVIKTKRQRTTEAAVTLFKNDCRVLKFLIFLRSSRISSTSNREKCRHLGRWSVSLLQYLQEN